MFDRGESGGKATGRQERECADELFLKRMPTHNKRVLVDSSSEDEEILYVMGKKTLKNMPMFVHAFAGPFWQQKDGEGPDEESSAAEIFLMTELCSTPGIFDEEKIVALLKDEKNHLPVMEALYCLLGYDLSMPDVEAGLQSDEEVAEVRRIVSLLPRWYQYAVKERERASKKRKSE